MNQRVVAVVGLSGVGKSTLLRSLAKLAEFQHLQASSVIRRERELGLAQAEAADLRTLNIDENQRLLINGFRRQTTNETPLVILDGHTIIDTPGGIVEIHPDVFCSMGIKHFVFLACDPEEIARRRQDDPERVRPVRSPDDLACQQELALSLALRAALRCGATINVLLSPDEHALADLVRRL